MPDFVLQDDQNVDVAVQLGDDAGNGVNDQDLDAGSVTAVVSDDSVAVAVVSDDQTSVNVKALGPEATGATVTVSGTVDGNPVANPGVFTFDVTTSPVTTILLTPGTPQHN